MSSVQKMVKYTLKKVCLHGLPLEYGVLFSKKIFSWGDKLSLGKFKGGVLHGGPDDLIMSGEGGFTNAFSTNLNTVNLNFSPLMVGYSLKDKALTIL